MCKIKVCYKSHSSDGYMDSENIIYLSNDRMLKPVLINLVNEYFNKICPNIDFDQHKDETLDKYKNFETHDICMESDEETALKYQIIQNEIKRSRTYLGIYILNK